MAVKPRTAPPAAPIDETETAEDAAVAAVAATNWDTVYIVATTIFLLAAIILVLREAGTHYAAGPFA